MKTLVRRAIEMKILFVDLRNKLAESIERINALQNYPDV
jgi:hypothetical protein